MRANTKATAGITVVAMAIGGGLAACGDDDGPPAGATVDGGRATEADASVGPIDGGQDAATVPDAADASKADAEIVPRTTTRLSNAINPYGLVFASDGFLYASGATIQDGDRKLAVWRFKDGVLDTTFGTAGVVTTAIDGDESSFDIVEVSAGKFVVHATAGGKVYLLELAKDVGGAYAFGAPVKVDFGEWADADPDWPGAAPPSYNSWGIGLDKSNAAVPKIVVFAAGAPAKVAAGGTQRTDNDRWIARVLAGTLAPDPAFNGGKAFVTDVDGKGLSDNARRGLVLADGSIVSSGYTNFGAGLGNHVVLIRLTSAGAVDAAFGFGGSTPGQTKANPFVASSGFAEAYAVVRQSSGRYVTTGYGTTNFVVPSKSVDLVSLGLKADALDPTYGKLGAFAWQSEEDKSAGLGNAPHTERGRDIAVLPDDRTVHAGVYDDFASIYVLAPNGKPESLLEYPFPAAFFRVVVSADGKRIAASSQSVTTTVDGGSVSQALLVTLGVAP